jgi:hypothetical protein
MSLLGSAPSSPAAAPIPPSSDQAAIAAQSQADEDARNRVLAAGRASTNVTGGLGDSSTPSLAVKGLLG